MNSFSSVIGTIRPSGLIPANLLKTLRLTKTASGSQDQEHLLQSAAVFSILIHIADIRRDLSDSWDEFAGGLLTILEPVTTAPLQTVTSAQLSEAADAVIAHCKNSPEAAETVSFLLEKVDVANVALPVDWKSKEDLLTSFHRLHDYLQRGQSRPSEGAGDAAGFMDVPIWYGTCRQPSGNNLTEAFYGIERADEVSVGLVRVSIPDIDNVAQTRSDLPFGWFWDRARTAKTGVRDGLMITKCMGMSQEYLKHHMAQNRRHVDKTLRGQRRGGQRGWSKGKSEAVVYVHGFNFRFGSAARKMALCAYKIQEDAPLFLFSWPSYQAIDSYSADESNAMWAVAHFVDFLTKMLTEFQLDKVHIIAHSMGSRVVLYALMRLALGELSEGSAKLGRLVLAAPDFDLGEFYQLQSQLSKTVEHVTIYASSADQALHVSSRIHGSHPRLGTFPISPGVRPWHVPFAENVDLVDATRLDKSLLGHGYVFSVPGVLTDACEFLRDGVPAERRPKLKETVAENGFRFYTFQGVAEDPWAELMGDAEDPPDAKAEAQWAGLGEAANGLPESSRTKLAKFFGDESIQGERNE
ncbi:hypothetical protein KFL_004320040 [Klebsormidium nitens]|uniref:Uncharacterized protein n=1 Tax=Klebsormidium nitens TaxID=105231 RepID=A0A1Y1IK11_KLENI|nr:hypothetical protein KFL_004320040 [Klebsormidium nitens]|eukprot:GAQ88478.1 hypothetical protein KFL_004320040 [Klebsormidium nitens]